MIEDLGIKFGSKEEAEWNNIMKAQEETIRNCKINQEVAEAILELAEKRLDQEKEKFK